MTTTNKNVKNVNGHNFRNLIDNYSKKVQKLVDNAKHPCARCDAQFIDTDVKLKLSKEWVCGRCSDGRSTNKMVDYKLNEVPDFIKNATALELNLCSINMVNTYKFSLQRKGPKNRFQYQSVVFENDLSSLTKLVLPRLPESCK